MIAKLKLRNGFTSTSPRLVFNELYCRIDFISSLDSNGGAVLKKMEAGSQLSDNLLSGFLILVAVYCLKSGGLTTTEALLASALGAVLLVSVVLRRMILIGRQDSLFTLLHTEHGTPKAIAS
jgi:hypothetical protein